MAIGTIFKNEALYLEEWINHYLNRKVDHFFLINDKSDDNYLEPKIDGLIHYYNK